MHPQSTPNEERTRSLSCEVCREIGGRPNRCGHNARDGFNYLSARDYDVRIALGFIVEHDRYEIQIIEHVWLVVREGENECIVDPTLPFLAVREVPTYFEGAVDNPDLPYPDLRNRAYKAAFLAAKYLAKTSKHPNQGPYKRPIHIGRIHWVEGLDAAEGRVSR